MNPLLILPCGVVIVLGGILWLRWPAFLALVIGAFGVALLTPSSSLQEYVQRRMAKTK